MARRYTKAGGRKSMQRIVLPFPVVPGKSEADVRLISNRFIAEPDAWAESRRRGGVTTERAYLQTTPMGMFVVAYIETTKTIAEAMAAPGQSDLEIDRFFVETVREV